MKLTARSTSRMYALTCLACVIWLWQSLVEANNDGSLFKLGHYCLLAVLASGHRMEWLECRRRVERQGD